MFLVTKKLGEEKLLQMILQQREAHLGGLTPTKVNDKMLYDIQTVLNRLIAKANKLLGNHTTNLAECWMHMRTKFDGEKVINRSQSGSWEHRVWGQVCARIWE